jgi:hypothetical protein
MKKSFLMSKIGWQEENGEGDSVGGKFLSLCGLGSQGLALARICFEPADHVRCLS